MPPRWKLAGGFEKNYRGTEDARSIFMIGQPQTEGEREIERTVDTLGACQGKSMEKAWRISTDAVDKFLPRRLKNCHHPVYWVQNVDFC